MKISMCFVQRIICGASFEHFELLIKSANNINILHSVIYCPPNTSLTNFINDFLQHLDHIESLSYNKKTSLLIYWGL